MNAEAKPEEEPIDEVMKIMIGYDGSGGCDEMLADLRRAGLPGRAEALVISISEAWFLLSDGILGAGTHFVTESLGCVKEALALAKQAAERIQSDFPGWNVRHTSAVGSPAAVLIERADEKRLLISEAEDWGADCIFVGARGMSRIERFWLGSVSTAVAPRAHCSVEVVREKQ